MPRHAAYKSVAGQAIHDAGIGTPDWWVNQIGKFESKRSAEVLENWKFTNSLYEQDQFTARRPRQQTTGRVILGEYIQPPRVYGITHAIESVLFNRHPKFFATPLTARQEKIARYIEIILNNQWKLDWKLNEQTRMALRDGIKFGWGIMLTEYAYTADPVERAKERRERQEAARMVQANPALQLGVSEVLGVLSDVQDSVTMPAKKATFERVSTSYLDQVNSRRVSPFQFIIDPDARGLDDALWVGRAIDADVEVLRKDRSFKNTDELVGTHMSRNVDSDTRSVNTAVPVRMYQGRDEIVHPSNQKMPAKRSDARYATIFEVFERNTDEDGCETWDYKVLTRDQGDFLKEVDAMYDLGCPYSLYAPNSTGERLFAQSDIDPAMTHILEEREVRTRAYEWMMRNANDAYGVDVNALGGNWETQVRKLVRTKVGNFIPFEAMSNRPVRDAVFQLPRTSLTTEYMNYLALIQRDIELATGLGPNQQMMAMKSETSATEAAEVAGWARARNQPKADAFEQFVADVAMKRIQIVAQEYEPERIMQLAGPKAAAQWAKEEWTKGDIQSGLMVTVEKGSMQPESDQKRQAILGMLLDKMLQNPVLASIGEAPLVAQRWLESMGIQDGSELIRSVGGEDFGNALKNYNQVIGQSGSAPGTQGAPQSPQESAQFEGVPA